MNIDMSKLDFNKAIQSAHETVMNDLTFDKMSIKTDTGNVNDVYNQITEKLMDVYSEKMSHELFLELFRQSNE